MNKEESKREHLKSPLSPKSSEYKITLRVGFELGEKGQEIDFFILSAHNSPHCNSTLTTHHFDFLFLGVVGVCW